METMVGDEEVISLLHTKVYVFSDSVLGLGKVNENPQSNTVWEEKLSWFKSSCQNWAIRQNLKDESSSCRCSMISYGDLKTMNRNVLPIPHLCLYSQKKNSSRTLVIPRAWIKNKVVFYLQWKTRRRMRWSRWIDDDQIRRERTPSFPSHESVVSRNAQKQGRWKTIGTLLCRWGYDWNCFSHNHFCQPAKYLRSRLRFVWRVR